MAEENCTPCAVGIPLAFEMGMPLAILVCSIWTLLAAASAAETRLGQGYVVLAATLAATLLAWIPGGCRARIPVLVGAWTAGCAVFPVLISVIAEVGDRLGLDPARPPGPPTLVLALNALVFAPVWEEHLYRGHVLAALRARLGSAPAVLVSSALFAVPHAEPWAVLGTGFVGLVLGALRCTGAPLGVCVALHAGLNARAVLGLCMAGGV
jgi:membrane protease YdiL (CAAX protease family)